MATFTLIMLCFSFVVWLLAVRMLWANDKTYKIRMCQLDKISNYAGTNEFSEEYIKYFEEVSYNQMVNKIAIFGDWRELYSEEARKNSPWLFE